MNTSEATPSNKLKKLASDSSLVFGVVNGSLALLLYIGIAIFALHNNSQSSRNDSSGYGADKTNSINASPNKYQEASTASISSTDTTSDQGNADYIRVTGIDLPVTNTLCTKKGNFCIKGLAQLVRDRSGQATYSFNEQVQGKTVIINGKIVISNSAPSSSNTPTLSLSFEDDQSSTTPGWAASGRFTILQDPDRSKPGILAKFKTTQSYGDKTPVGLENTSYLFPVQ